MSASEMVVIIRPSFMKFCQDGCKAAAFNHALYWIAYKAKGQAKEKIQSGEITWYATTEEFTEGLANAWGVCKVRQAVNSIIDMGLIGRGANKHWKVDRTKHFFFGKDQCATLLDLCKKHDICLLHLGLHADVLQMINLSNATGVQLQCTCEQMIKSSDASIDLSDGPMYLSNPCDDFIETIPKDTTKATSKISNKGGEKEGINQNNEQQETSLLSDDQEKFLIDIFYQSKIGQAKPPVDVNLQKHLIRLMEFTQTVEELDSLYEYVQKRLLETNLKDKTVYPGNLTNAKYLGGWLQEQERKTKEVENMDPYVRACMISAGQLTEPSTTVSRSTRRAATPGSQYIVDTLEEAAEEQLAKFAETEEKEWRHPVLISPEKRQRNLDRLMGKLSEQDKKELGLDFASPTFYEDRRKNTRGI